MCHFLLAVSRISGDQSYSVRSLLETDNFCPMSTILNSVGLVDCKLDQMEFEDPDKLNTYGINLDYLDYLR